MPIVFFPEEKYPVTKSTDPREVKKRYMAKYVRKTTTSTPTPLPSKDEPEDKPGVEPIPETELFPEPEKKTVMKGTLIHEINEQIKGIDPTQWYYTDETQTRRMKGNVVISKLEEQRGQIKDMPQGSRFEKTEIGYTVYIPSKPTVEEYPRQEGIVGAIRGGLSALVTALPGFEFGYASATRPLWTTEQKTALWTPEMYAQVEATRIGLEETATKKDILGLTKIVLPALIIPLTYGLFKGLGVLSMTKTGATPIISKTIPIVKHITPTTLISGGVAVAGTTMIGTQLHSVYQEEGLEGLKREGFKLAMVLPFYGLAGKLGYQAGIISYPKYQALGSQLKTTFWKGYQQYTPKGIQQTLRLAKTEVIRYDPWFLTRQVGKIYKYLLPDYAKKITLAYRQFPSKMAIQKGKAIYIKGAGYYGLELYPIALKHKLPFATRDPGLYPPMDVYSGYTVGVWQKLPYDFTKPMKTTGRFLYDPKTGHAMKLAHGREWQSIYQPVKTFKEPGKTVWGVKEPGRYYIDPVTSEISKIPRPGKPIDLRPVDIGAKKIVLGEPKTVDLFTRKFWHTPGMGEVTGFQRYNPMPNIFASVRNIISVKTGRPLLTVTTSMKGITAGSGISGIPSTGVVGGFRMPGGFALAYGMISLSTLEFLEEGTTFIHPRWGKAKPIEKTSFDLEPTLRIDRIQESFSELESQLDLDKALGFDLDKALGFEPGIKKDVKRDVTRKDIYKEDIARVPAVTPAVLSLTAQAQAQAQVQLQAQMMLTQQILTPELIKSPKIVSKLSLRPKSQIPKIVSGLPELDVEIGKKEDIDQGYAPLVKERYIFDGKPIGEGKFARMDRGVYSKKDALRLGAHLVDQSASASFKVLPVSGKPEELEHEIPSWKILKNKFYPKGDILIEKTLHRIDSTGELEGITAKGILASMKKRKETPVKPKVRRAKVSVHKPSRRPRDRLNVFDEIDKDIRAGGKPFGFRS